MIAQHENNANRSESTPILSVIIPCYNMGQYVEKAIQSVLSQPTENIEVILVNDGSTDNTEAIASQFSNIRYARQTNQGVSVARNHGLSLATGKWITFLDADDFLLPNYWEQLHPQLTQEKTAKAICFGWQFADADGNLTGAQVCSYNGTLTSTEILTWNRLFPHCVVVERSAIQVLNGFDSSLSVTADWDMWIRLSLAGIHFWGIPKALVAYRITPGSMSKNWKRAREDGLKLIEKTFARQDLPSEIDALQTETRGRYLTKIGIEALAEDDIESAVNDFSAGIQSAPQLLEDEEIHFALACCKQSLQFRGTNNEINLPSMYSLVTHFLLRVSDQLNLPQNDRKAMWVTQKRVFAKLAYQQRNRTDMGKYLSTWVLKKPTAVFSPHFWGWIARAIILKPRHVSVVTAN